MSWTRRLCAALAGCVLLLAGSAGCGTGDAREGGASPAPVGKILEDRGQDGQPLREVAPEGAPDVGIEVQPDAAGGWDVRLTVRNFRFSPAGTAARPVAGRGLARLFVDGRPVTRLRTSTYRLDARLVPRGTHHVTARLHADDGTVWAVEGKPVQSTADITASEPGPAMTSDAASRRKARTQGVDTGDPGSPDGGRDAPGGRGSPPGGPGASGGRGSPDGGRRAS
ncbi:MULTISPECIES: hypothetical protein [Streptomyces]|uniref:hypothetical protein n=1 Tax=Streptomyces TaxID=1883 RepID=UPI000CF29448|nr:MULTISPECIES: hypothetical protein [Streptomyces]PPS76315.1 hypothetical protein BV882_05260 [Streptomyces sp. 46]